MKKLFLFICLMLSAVGCSCKDTSQYKISKGDIPTVEESSSYLYGEYGLLTYELDSTDEYDDKIASKDSFILFIYREGCFGCQKLSPALGDYVSENEGSVIYSMEIETIKSNHTLYKDENISGTPWLILIEEGAVAYKEVMPVENDTEAKAKDWLYGWMEKYVIWEE